jgi:hypothetical protein
LPTKIKNSHKKNNVELFEKRGIRSISISMRKKHNPPPIPQGKIPRCVFFFVLPQRQNSGTMVVRLVLSAFFRSLAKVDQFLPPTSPQVALVASEGSLSWGAGSAPTDLSTLMGPFVFAVPKKKVCA